MSKPKNSRPVRNRFVPRLGQLEDRMVPAGNVAALVGDGILYVVGDDADNKIWIRGAGGTRVTISSTDGTLINGQAEATFDGVNGGFHLVMNGGNDAVALTGVNAYRNLNVDLGAGDDGFMMVDVVSWRTTNVLAGAGADTVSTHTSTFIKDMVIDSGDGNDAIALNTSYFGRQTYLNAGTGGNTLDRATSFFVKEPIAAGFDNPIVPIPPVQNPPIANNDTGTVTRGGTVSINVAANDVAQTGSLNLSSITITRNPSFGTVSVTGNGSVSYTNNATSTSTVDSYQYTIRDTNGNVSNAATVSISITDSSNPTVTVSTTANDPTNVSPITYNIDFSEDVAILNESAITITNGTVDALTRLNARSYRLTVTPTANGTVTVVVPAGAVNDLSGNPNLVSNTVTRVFDDTDPSITINALTTNDTTPTITGTVEAGSTVSVTVDGQTVNATVTGTTWSATLTTALAEGTYTITATATDAAGNTGNATLTDGLVIDLTAPTATLTTTEPDPTTQTTIPFTVTFSEAVTGFTATGLTITNGTVTNFVAVDGTTYTFDVVATADGLVTVVVNAGAATDAAGNTNPEATADITVEGVPPTPVITTTATNPTNLATIPFTVTFNENVTGFDATDLSVTNGTVSNFTAVDGRTYTFDVTPAADGTVTIDIAAGAAQDSAGNDSLAATFDITSDRTVPTAAITTTASDPTNLPSVPFTVTFSEAVTGFTAAGLTVTNGTVSNFVAVNATTYTFDVAPLDNGTLTVTVNAGAGQDGAGNDNPVSTFTIEVLGLQAQPVITSTATNPTNLATIPFTVTFNIPVTGFDDTDILVGNGTLSNFTAVDARTYTFDVTPTADGDVTINIAAGAAQAVSDGSDSLAATFTITSDRTAPAFPQITGLDPSSGGGTTNSRTPTLIGTSDPGVTIEVFSDNGPGPVSIGTTTADANGDWRFTPTTDIADGIYNITATATDAAGNVSAPSFAFTLTVDATAPVATITTTAPNPTDLASIPFTVTFNEDVTGFNQGGLTILNGAISNFVAVDARTYTFDVAPAADGPVTVGVQGGAAQDAAGNSNAAVLFSIVSERMAPTTLIITTANDPTNLSPIPFTVSFSEFITGFDATDIAVTNGTLSNFTVVDARTFTFDVTPTADGTVTVSIAAGAAQDGAGNDSTAATFSIESDRTAPAAPVITGIDPADDFGLQGDGITNVPSPFIIGTATAGAVVTLLSDNGTGEVLFGTGTADGSGAWSIQANSPLADGTYTLVATVSDTAGNVARSAPFTLIIDTVGPVPVFSTLAPNPTNASPISMTLTFSEDTASFALEDLMVTNGTVANLSSLNARTYFFDLVPTADGTVTIDIAAGAAFDIAGNASVAGTFSIVSDRTPPTGAINGTGFQLISGTATDGQTGIARVRISIFDGTFYWDGTDFASTTEMFFEVTTTDDFATWGYVFTKQGTFTVNAQITDDAGNDFSLTNTVTVT